jgi:DNA helicase-2/ATP-dependent DNA helicase PcrA
MNSIRKAKLNQINNDPKQCEAYSSKKNTVVIAGPGSGKTTVLSMKILNLLENYITNPQGIACITYSREAAREIKDRLVTFGYNNTHKNSFFGTVHSFCIAEVLVPFSHLFDHFSLPFPIRIATTKQRTNAFKHALKNLIFSDDQVSITDMNRERKFGIIGESRIEIPSYDIALQVAREYEKILHDDSLIDFDDIVNYSTILIQKEEFVRRCLEAKFPWLLVDEYQDLGKPLHEIILSLLLKTDIKLFAVGDPDQSIYGFQGAIPDYLKELTTFKNRINTVILEKNYRSNQEIIEASEVILQENRGYLAGTREKERAVFHFFVREMGMEEQYNLVVQKLIPEYVEKERIPLNEIAVLVGTNKEVMQLAVFFQEFDIPYYISKQNFERTEFVQWLENCAKWVVDNATVSFDTLWSYWAFLTLSTNNDINGFKERVKFYNHLSDSVEKREDLRLWITFLKEHLNFEEVFTKSLSCSGELDNLNLLLKAIGEQNNLDIKNFSKLGKPQNQVTISTRHSCKGLEFEVVILLGMEDGRFPFYSDINDPNKLTESSRICFVCISRAKRVCILVRSKKHILDTRRGPWEKNFEPSRFWTILENWQKSKKLFVAENSFNA